MGAARTVGGFWSVLAALTLTMQACAIFGPLDKEPDLTGMVESIDPEHTFLVLENVVFRWGATGGNEAIIRTRDATVAQYADELGIWVPLNRRDIPLGASVRVWTDGVELRSDPPQYRAVRIEMPSARGP